MTQIYKIITTQTRKTKLKHFSIGNTATVITVNTLTLSFPSLTLLFVVCAPAMGVVTFGKYAASRAAIVYPKPYPNSPNIAPINVDNIPANTAANAPIIVVSIALNSATNNPPIKLLFAVSTAPNGVSNPSPFCFQKFVYVVVSHIISFSFSIVVTTATTVVTVVAVNPAIKSYSKLSKSLNPTPVGPKLNTGDGVSAGAPIALNTNDNGPLKPLFSNSNSLFNTLKTLSKIPDSRDIDPNKPPNIVAIDKIIAVNNKLNLG